MRVLVEAPSDVQLTAGLHLFVAPNGSGKTTLMRTLAGLHPALNGGAAVTGRIHYVSDQMQLDEELTPRAIFRIWFSGDALISATRLAERLGLEVGCVFGKLSRGNKQKVLLILAETMAADSGPSLLFLDEPLAGMDAETRAVVAEVWASTNASILRLVVLHELEAVRKADSLFTVCNGELRHTFERAGDSWSETCRRLRAI